jgi:hypothetical protein
MASLQAAAESSGVRLSISDVQQALRADSIDGWLLYDFRGTNPIAADITAVSRQGGHLATRRWYYLIPATGAPRQLVHAIEPNSLAHLPGTATKYAGRDQLEAGLKTLLGGLRRIAMEYSPGCAIPYVSRVDGGTIELVRQCGVDVVSSGDLIQRFSAVWDIAAIATHREASAKLYRVKDRAFDLIARRLRDRRRDDRIRRPAGNGRMVPGRGTGCRCRSKRFRGTERWESALSAHRRRSPTDNG